MTDDLDEGTVHTSEVFKRFPNHVEHQGEGIYKVDASALARDLKLMLVACRVEPADFFKLLDDYQITATPIQ